MADASAFQRRGVFPFMSLPAELRRQIYRFAIVEPHPIALDFRYRGPRQSVRVFARAKDLRMLETCSEFRTEMRSLLYSENSFCFSSKWDELEAGTELFQVDIARIEKCSIWIGNISSWDFDDDEEIQFELNSKGHALNDVVEILVFKGHQMKYLLVECETQFPDGLAEGLKSMAMLRNMDLVHFRSRSDLIQPYFRFLEDLMMSDRPLPFKCTREEFSEKVTRSHHLLKTPDFGGDAMTGNAVVKSEEQMEATAKELYSVLGMDDFTRQSELG